MKDLIKILPKIDIRIDSRSELCLEFEFEADTPMGYSTDVFVLVFNFDPREFMFIKPSVFSNSFEIRLDYLVSLYDVEKVLKKDLKTLLYFLRDRFEKEIFFEVILEVLKGIKKLRKEAHSKRYRTLCDIEKGFLDELYSSNDLTDEQKLFLNMEMSL